MAASYADYEPEWQRLPPLIKAGCNRLPYPLPRLKRQAAFIWPAPLLAR